MRDRFEALPSELRVKPIGEVYAENAMAALLAAMAAGVSAERAVPAIGAVTTASGRFEVLAEQPRIVIDYAHTPDALRRTLLAARRLCAGKLTVVFGAGGGRDQDKRGPMGAASEVADRIVLTSDNPRQENPQRIADAIAAGITNRSKLSVELSRAHAIAQVIAHAAPEDVVVIAGKGHETTQVIGHIVRPFSDHEAAQQALEARK